MQNLPIEDDTEDRGMLVASSDAQHASVSSGGVN
jgi:hypothetical protein